MFGTKMQEKIEGGEIYTIIALLPGVLIIS
jgi:hypothetical protein